MIAQEDRATVGIDGNPLEMSGFCVLKGVSGGALTPSLLMWLGGHHWVRSLPPQERLLDVV
jgi:hypothetical protein